MSEEFITIKWSERIAAKITDLIGLTLSSIDVSADRDAMRFTSIDGREFCMFHDSECCETVSIEDIAGDLSDLIGEPILIAEESSNENTNPPGVPVPDWQDSFTWTFYKLATRKGYVDIRWYGESNGYYSESVDFYEKRKQCEKSPAPFVEDDRYYEKPKDGGEA